MSNQDDTTLRPEQTSTRPGFAALCAELEQREVRHMSETWPQAAAAIAESTNADIAHQVSKSAGITPDNPSALEAALAYGTATHNLSKTVSVGRSYATTPAATRDPELATLILESLHVQLSACVDAAERLATKSMAPISDTNDTRLFRSRKNQWKKETKATLSNPRQVAAHSETVYIEAITEEGLWGAPLLSGIFELAYIDDQAVNLRVQDSKKFVGRFSVAQALATLVLTSSDELLSGTAQLLRADSS